MFKRQRKSCGTTSNPRIQDQVKSFQALGLIPFYILISMLLMLAGCAKQTSISQPINRQAVTLSEEERARLYDISFPPDVTPERLSSKEGQVFSCISNKPVTVLFEFYRTEMEYLGWNLVTAIKSEENCMIFEKPTKRCIVTMRAHMNPNQGYVLIFLAAKQ